MRWNGQAIGYGTLATVLLAGIGGGSEWAIGAGALILTSNRIEYQLAFAEECPDSGFLRAYAIITGAQAINALSFCAWAFAIGRVIRWIWL